MNAPVFHRASRIADIALSEIVQISETAARMKAEGRDIVALSTGEPDFPTPAHVCMAATEAMNAGQTRYPATAGTAALRRAIAVDAAVEPAQVIVTTGAKQALANLFLAALEHGDEVICPAPYWTSYRDIVGMAGGRVIEIACGADQGFKLTPAQLAAAITPRTRFLLINSPSNPSGALYSAAELRALGEVLDAHPHVWLVSDEIYRHIAYAPFVSVRTALPALSDRTVVIDGVSKAYAMTGWRIGWAIGPSALIAAMVAVQGQITSGACSIAQAAALAALTGPQHVLAERADAFRARRDRLVAGLNAIPGMTCAMPDGAFYAFPSCAGLIGRTRPDGTRIADDSDFCRHVLEAEGLAVVPGRAFGAPGHLRLSYAYSQAELDEGLARLTRAAAALT